MVDEQSLHQCPKAGHIKLSSYDSDRQAMQGLFTTAIPTQTILFGTIFFGMFVLTTFFLQYMMNIHWLASQLIFSLDLYQLDSNSQLTTYQYCHSPQKHIHIQASCQTANLPQSNWKFSSFFPTLYLIKWLHREQQKLELGLVNTKLETNSKIRFGIGLYPLVPKINCLLLPVFHHTYL